MTSWLRNNDFGILGPSPSSAQETIDGEGSGRRVRDSAASSPSDFSWTFLGKKSFFFFDSVLGHSCETVTHTFSSSSGGSEGPPRPCKACGPSVCPLRLICVSQLLKRLTTTVNSREAQVRNLGVWSISITDFLGEPQEGCRALSPGRLRLRGSASPAGRALGRSQLLPCCWLVS